MGARLFTSSYATILAFLLRPRTAIEVAQHIGTSVERTRQVLRRMNQMQGDRKLIYIAGWTEPALCLSPRPMYRVGNEADVPAPLRTNGKVSRYPATTVKPIRPNGDLRAFAHVVSLLRAEPQTIEQLSDNTGFTKETISRLISHMRGLGVVFIERYAVAAAGAAAKCYRWGLKPDADPPLVQRPHRSRALAFARSHPGGFSVFNQRA